MEGVERKIRKTVFEFSSIFTHKIRKLKEYWFLLLTLTSWRWGISWNCFSSIHLGSFFTEIFHPSSTYTFTLFERALIKIVDFRFSKIYWIMKIKERKIRSHETFKLHKFLMSLEKFSIFLFVKISLLIWIEDERDTQTWIIHTKIFHDWFDHGKKCRFCFCKFSLLNSRSFL